MATDPLSFPMLNTALKAAAETTRIRVLALLAETELTVSDLTEILRQSQPRISRHLKLLAEAGLIDRHPEGAWVFYRLTDASAAREFAATLFAHVDAGDAVLTRDRELLKRRTVTHGCYVHALKPAAQLQEIVERLDLARSARPFALCLHCNVPLRPVDKASVVDRLPPRVQMHYDRFSRCDRCGRVYWEGSHWLHMRQMLDGVLSP